MKIIFILLMLSACNMPSNYEYAQKQKKEALTKVPEKIDWEGRICLQSKDMMDITTTNIFTARQTGLITSEVSLATIVSMGTEDESYILEEKEFIADLDLETSVLSMAVELDKITGAARAIESPVLPVWFDRVEAQRIRNIQSGIEASGCLTYSNVKTDWSIYMLTFCDSVGLTGIETTEDADGNKFFSCVEIY